MAHSCTWLSATRRKFATCGFQTTLDLEGHQALCVPSSSQALELLNRGVSAAVRSWTRHAASRPMMYFLPALMERVGSDKLCLLSEMGDTRHRLQTQRWNIRNTFTKPLLRRDVEKLTFCIRVFQRRRSTLPNFIWKSCRRYRFLAASPAMMQIYRDIRVLAPVDIPVLILGESGVGKEISADVAGRVSCAL